MKNFVNICITQHANTLKRQTNGTHTHSHTHTHTHTRTYTHKPVCEQKDVIVWRNQEVQTDRQVRVNMPDVMIRNKK